MPATFGIAAISIAGKARSYVPCLRNKTPKNQKPAPRKFMSGYGDRAA